MVAGLNDAMDGCPHNEFLFNVDRACDKLKLLSTKIPPTIHVVLPQLREGLPPVCEQRLTYVNNKLRQLQCPHLQVVDLPPVALEDPLHPSREGTHQLLQHLQTALPNPLILNADFITGNRIYMDNTSVYIYGCSTCNQVRDITHGHCNTCREDMANYQPPDTAIDMGVDAFPPLLFPEGNLGLAYATITLRKEAIKNGYLQSTDDGWVIYTTPLPPEQRVIPEEGMDQTDTQSLVADLFQDASADLGDPLLGTADGNPPKRQRHDSSSTTSTTTESTHASDGEMEQALSA